MDGCLAAVRPGTGSLSPLLQLRLPQRIGAGLQINRMSPQDRIPGRQRKQLHCFSPDFPEHGPYLDLPVHPGRLAAETKSGGPVFCRCLQAGIPARFRLQEFQDFWFFFREREHFHGLPGVSLCVCFFIPRFYSVPFRYRASLRSADGSPVSYHLRHQTFFLVQILQAPPFFLCQREFFHLLQPPVNDRLCRRFQKAALVFPCFCTVWSEVRMVPPQGSRTVASSVFQNTLPKP